MYCHIWTGNLIRMVHISLYANDKLLLSFCVLIPTLISFEGIHHFLYKLLVTYNWTNTSLPQIQVVYCPIWPTANGEQLWWSVRLLQLPLFQLYGIQWAMLQFSQRIWVCCKICLSTNGYKVVVHVHSDSPDVKTEYSQPEKHVEKTEVH